MYDTINIITTISCYLWKLRKQSRSSQEKKFLSLNLLPVWLNVTKCLVHHCMMHISSPPKQTPYSLAVTPCFPLSPSSLFFVSKDLPILDTSYKWHHIVWWVLCNWLISSFSFTYLGRLTSWELAMNIK